uniref:Uncharacterized protein n=1 Tax=Aplanochytrium stocchinoi TaxID=215587 RepID=A0A7S3V2D6_9STRA
MVRTKQQSGNFFFDAITTLEQELVSSPSTKALAMLNTILDNTFALIVQSIEDADTSQYDLNNCESQGTTFPVIDIYAGFDVPGNLSSIWTECSVVPAPALTPTEAELLVQYDPLIDSYLDLSESSMVQYISESLNSDLLEENGPANVLDFIDYFFVDAASDPENLFYEFLSLRDDNGEDVVDLVVNLNDQGSFIQSLFDTDFVYEDNRVIPGFRVQATQLKVSRINKLLTRFKFLQPISRFVTSNQITFTDTELLIIELTGSYEYDASFVGDKSNPNRKIVQSFSAKLDLTGLDIDFALLLAIDTNKVSSLYLGHFLEVSSPNQEIFPSPTIISCLLSSAFTDGISIPRLSVNIDSLPLTPVSIDLGASVSSNPLQDRAVSPGVEQVLQESVNVALNFYADAIPNVCQNCVRDYINKELKKRGDAARAGIFLSFFC